MTPIDEELARLLRRSQRPVILVVNKIDHAKHENFDGEFQRLGFEELLSISAAHSRGIDALGRSDRGASSARERPSEPASNATAPLSLAIVGRPNVGKSSLINAILSDRRTIVSNIPGTTRDAVDIAYSATATTTSCSSTPRASARAANMSNSVEVFSVMRSERTIRRADLCVLVIDATMGVTAQDKKIAGADAEGAQAVAHRGEQMGPREAGRTIRKKRSPSCSRKRGSGFSFCLTRPVLVASALTGENVERLFTAIRKIRRAAQEHLGTGPLNRLLREAFAANPPPMSANKRMKLFYATQTRGQDRPLATPEFVLFVNDPQLLGDTYARYLEAQIRAAEPFHGLPLMLNFRPRTETKK